MSRTRKGSKGLGWEPWSNRHEKAEQKADYREPEPDLLEDEICPGCRFCICVKCGGHLAAIDPERWDSAVRCIHCGHEERDEEEP